MKASNKIATFALGLFDMDKLLRSSKIFNNSADLSIASTDGVFTLAAVSAGATKYDIKVTGDSTKDVAVSIILDYIELLPQRDYVVSLYEYDGIQAVFTSGDLEILINTKG